MKEGIADKNLIAKWKKQGYENLCCLRCIQTRDTNFGTNCVCRVPKGKLEEVSINQTKFVDLYKRVLRYQGTVFILGLKRARGRKFQTGTFIGWGHTLGVA